MRLPPSSLSPWPLAERETVAEHPVFSVQRSRYGNHPERAFYTLQMPDWSNVLPVTPDGQVVLVRQFRFGTQAISIEVPGGMIEPGETPLAGAARELLEETGYSSDELALLHAHCPNPAIQGNRIHSFVAWNAVPTRAGTAFGMANESEETEVLLWPRARLAELLDSGAIDHSLCAIVVETFLRKFGPG